SDDDRRALRGSFDRAADLYQRARPDYPEELLDDLVAVAGLAPGDRLLEVGCATGKATLPLARRGFRITCVELGAHLAEAARRNLAGLDVEVVEGRFEDWQPRAGERFDLVFAATVWNWIDPAVRYVVHVRHFDWERVYDAEGYIQLLNTFSGHIMMEDWKRQRLFGEIRLRLGRRQGAAVRRHWGAVLHVAQRRDR